MRGAGEAGAWAILALVALAAPPALRGAADASGTPVVQAAKADEEAADPRCPQSEARLDLSLAHVTKKNGLPPEYIPPNLIDVEGAASSAGAVCVTGPTAAALGRMFAAARADGIDLRAFSGYRTPDDQKSIMRKWRALEGAFVDRAVAPPGHSEHQTGTAVDITGISVGFAEAQNGFEKTPEYGWLAANAWKYGFNLSYPKTLKDGGPGEYRFEPWHWRFVGVPLAADLHRLGISYNEMETAEEPLYSTTSTAGSPAIQ